MAQYIYGKNLVLQRCKEKKAITIMYLQEGIQHDQLLSFAKKASLKVEMVSRKKLDTLAKGGKHQGVVCEIEDYKTVTVDEIVGAIPKSQQGLIVMLDQLEDPHNLGAILRTCDAIGAHGVIIKKNNSVKLNATVAKVSTGAIETVKVAEVTNLTQTLNNLKTKGYWVFGADADNAQDYRTFDYDVPLVLVIGSEGKGISRLVKEQCDKMISLPMVGSVSSLNASVACGILLYQIHQKRFPL